MIILRQKEYSFLGLWKKKTESKEEKNYTCPTLDDLQKSNPSIAQGLRATDRIWNKPETQEALKVLNERVIFSDTLPFFTYGDNEKVRYAWKEFVYPALKLKDASEDTKIIPLMWDSMLGGGFLLCYNLGEGHFCTIDGNDYNLNNDYKNCSKIIDCMKIFYKDLKTAVTLEVDDEAEKALESIKKAFWL